jgi:FXSXX-COOH protein
MGDSMADGGLIDVSELSLNELLEEVDDSSLTHALHRIFASGDEGAEQHGFQSNI